MKLDDIDRCLDLWRQAGFHEDRKTVVSALEATPGGLYVAEMEGGEIIGTCSANMVREDTAFVGFYVVEASLRGKGVGKDMWSKTYDRVYPSMNIGLNAVPYMADKYRSCGMREENSNSLVLYQLPAGDETLSEKVKQLPGELDDDLRLIEINNETGEALFKKLADYNRQVVGFCREEWLSSFLRGEDVPLTLAIVKGPAKEEQLVAFGCIRHDNFGDAMIGPLYANTPELSRIVLRNLIEKLALESDKGYYAMSLKDNLEAAKNLEMLGLKKVDEYARLFSRFIPEAQHSQIFYIQSAGFTLF